MLPHGQRARTASALGPIHLRGLMIFIRRTDETGHVHMLGQRFAVSPHWPHRLASSLGALRSRFRLSLHPLLWTQAPCVD